MLLIILYYNFRNVYDAMLEHQRDTMMHSFINKNKNKNKIIPTLSIPYKLCFTTLTAYWTSGTLMGHARWMAKEAGHSHTR